MKIVALTTVSTPYIIARYSAFAKQYPEYSLCLIEFGKVSTTYQWEYVNCEVPYERVILSDQPVEFQSRFNLWHLVIKALTQSQADLVVICGYGVSGMLSALAWSLFHRKPTILLSDTTENVAPRVKWRETMKSWITQRYTSALVAGQPQRRYLIKLGMLPKATFLGYDVVDNEVFHPNKIRHLPNMITKPYFLAVNRFVKKKNIFFLLSSYVRYRQLAGSTAWNLVLCGDGELRSQIEQEITKLGLEKVIHLPGFLQQKDLLPYFAHAECFVHASLYEEWGLVVNEAMAAGLPILVSNRCGCFEDLVIEGLNGFGFDPENPEQFTTLMVEMSSGNIDITQMGNASLSHIQNFSPDYFAKGLTQAIEYALNHS